MTGLVRVLVTTFLAAAPFATAACEVTDADRAFRVKAALRAGYGVQYWGESYRAEALAQAAHGLLILEAAKIGAPDAPNHREVLFEPAEMGKISRNGTRPVLVYLNLTEVEPWRDYWPADRRDPPWLGPVTPTGDRLAAFWRPEWRAVLRERVARLMATGADGLFLDDALNYFAAGSLAAGTADAPADIRAAADVMLALVQEVAASARAIRCDALIVVNNAVFVGRDAGANARDAFDAYRDAIDAVMIEDGLGNASHPDLHAALREDYLMRGVPVLSLDFAEAASADVVAGQARALGYAPYVAPDGSFSSLAPPARSGF